MTKRKAVDTIENSITKIIRRDNVKKARAYLEGTKPTPYQALISGIEAKKVKPIDKGDHVLHWFRQDLRVEDNRALRKASELAKKLDKPLITLYIVSPAEWAAHSVSDVKIDLILRSLQSLRKKLQELQIPLVIDSIEGRDFRAALQKICDKYAVHNVFANFEYEIDELQRDLAIVENHNGVNFELHHDQCIVEPELIKAKNGNAYKVFKAWYNDWCRYIYHDDEYLTLNQAPAKNKRKVETQADNINIWDSQNADSERAKRMKALYVDDEDAVYQKLTKFIAKDLKDYEALKDHPSLTKSSVLSPYINIGLISTRRIVKAVLDQYDKTKASSTAFIREVAWRDFYRHKIVEFPHVVMNLPFNLKTDKMQWENDPVKFEKWCKGETGFPFIDASMKKLNKDGYMINRCRMVCATFLVKNLLVDWRYGEAYFMTKLVDGDFASNNGGWGFVSSTGVNCQPYFRVFNPDLQQDKFDKDLEFIHEWLPDFDEDNYLEPIVDYKETKAIFTENFKNII